MFEKLFADCKRVIKISLTVFVALIVLVLFLSSPTELALSDTELELAIGERFQLTVERLDRDKLTWSSSDPAVARVNQRGDVVALFPGTAEIAVEAEGLTTVCTVVVPIPDVANLQMAEYLPMVIGDSKRIEPAVEPAEAKLHDDWQWTSNDFGVATIDSEGNVTAVGLGSTVITAQLGGTEATCLVTVHRPMYKESLQRTWLPFFDFKYPEIFLNTAGTLFAYRTDIGKGGIAVVADRSGNYHVLPDFYEYGPPTWQGDKLIYQVVKAGDGGWDELERVVYIYDPADQSSLEIDGIPETIPSSSLILRQNQVFALANDGIWSYDLPTETWAQITQLALEGTGPVWSPDGRFLAWWASEGLAVLDVDSGEKPLVAESGRGQIAWCWDNMRLAILSHQAEELQIFARTGEVQRVFPVHSNEINHWRHWLRNLSWVPGENKVSFQDSSTLFVIDVDYGRRWANTGAPPTHIWLADGRLAYSGPTERAVLLETFAVQWD
ncbi:MAG: hypothetical protein FH749_05830 [Firmicutes bacterium]|nr:hypothetical protein [Bacillota bacterium]